MNLNQFEVLITHLMAEDNQLRGQAETTFNELKKSPDFLTSSLVELVRNSSQEQVRALCTILLRRVLSGTDSLWNSITPQSQQTVKLKLLESIEKEQISNIRKKISDTISEIGSFTIELGQWNELLPFMFKCTKSPNDAHRESAFQIFSQLAIYIAQQIRTHFGTLRDTLNAGLNDSSVKVKLAALGATANFLQILAEPHERQQFQQLIPIMLGTISTALNEQKEEDAQTAIELFVDLAELDPTFLRPCLASVVQAMMTIASHTSLEDATRQLGVEFLITLCESKPTMLRKLPKFVENLIPIVLKFMLDLEDDEDWNEQSDEDNIDIANSDVGEEALDRLALALGGKSLVPALFSILPSLMSNSDWKHRHAALMALSVIGEGCNKYIAPNLNEIVKTILVFTKDPHPRVRWAACNTIGQMSTDFGPEFQQAFHNSVLPSLVAVMDDRNNPRVQSHAAAAIINFCEHCTADLLQPYLDELLQKLVFLLQSGKKIVQEQAVTAIAAVADCAEENFNKYYDTFIPYLKSLLAHATDKEYRMLRGKTIECISLIGVAVGKEKFAPDAKEIMELMIRTQSSNLEPDDPQVSFLLQSWARICRCLGQDFVPYLPHVMPPLLASAKLQPDVKIRDADDDTESQEGWDFIPVGDKRIGINTSSLEEKATACNMLYCYASELKEGFWPYVDEVTKILVPLMRFYYHDGVRSAAISTIPHLLTSASLFIKKSGGATGADIHYVRNVLNYMFPTLMDALLEEMEIDILVTGLETLADSLKIAADDSLSQDQMKRLIDVLIKLAEDVQGRRAERKSRQSEEDHDDEEEEKIEDEDRSDDSVLSGISEVIGTLARYNGKMLLSFFELLKPMFYEMIKPESKASDRQTILCVLDDMLEHIGQPSLQVLQDFLPFAVQYIGDSDPALRQAAVFGMGVLCQAAGQQIASQVPEILSRLIAVITGPDARTKDYTIATDNAIGSVGKICELGLTDIKTILPMWLSWFPVVEDNVESKITYSIFLRFLENQNPFFIGQNFEHIPKILNVLATIYGTNLIHEELNQRIVNIFRKMQSSYPPEILTKAWNSLTPEQQQKLQTIK